MTAVAFYIELHVIVVEECLAIRPECMERGLGCDAVNPSVLRGNLIPCFSFLVCSIKLWIYERYLKSGFFKAWKHRRQEYAWYVSKEVSCMGDRAQCLIESA